jgi:rSAM/selenodomain-associated transferase 1
LTEEALIIFVKAPRPGFVKTRLGLGPEAECAAYQRLAQAVLREVTHFDDVELRFSPIDGEKEIQPWLRPGWRAAPQADGDLGVRLTNAFAQAFGAGARRVVIIGSDCPYLLAEDITTAWAQLRNCDVILGPALDGGYWLIGLTQTRPELFHAIPWSSDQVLSATLARVKALGLKTVLLRALSDVDTSEDWARFISSEAREHKPYRSPAGD